MKIPNFSPLPSHDADIKSIVDKRTGPDTIGIGVGPVSSGAIQGYHFFLFGNQLGLQLADGLGFTNYFSNTLPLGFPGSWNHVAVTVSRSSSLITFYLNGAFWGSSTPIMELGSLENNSPLRIGARTTATALTGFFQGSLDELEIFNRVLTQLEVKSVFGALTAGKCKPPHKAIQ